MRALVRLLLSVAAVSAAACGPAVDLTKGLTINIVNTGWYDAGIVNGQNKLVPAVSFTVKNVSDQRLVSLQVNALFRRVTEADEWGSELVIAAGSSGLPAGQITSVLMAKSPRGYTGSDQSRQEMLQNTHFVDAKVDLFAKYGSTQWTRLGTYPITRQLLTK
ncbi:MAG TPA: hypothetical protein VKD69_09935 [Vicinamibacterales bacterium]|nr:hypothetical protein [Vicinamibacterales bacterium]